MTVYPHKRRLESLLFAAILGLLLVAVPSGALGQTGRAASITSPLSATTNISSKIADYTRKIARSPQNADLYNERGTLYADLRRFDKAIEDYTQAIRLEPKNSRGYLRRAHVYRELQPPDSPQSDFAAKAVVDYTTLLALGYRDSEIYYLRGLAYEKCQDYPRAITDFTRALLWNWSDAAAYYHRGLAYDRLLQPDKALGDYLRALQHQPDGEFAAEARKKIEHLRKMARKSAP